MLMNDPRFKTMTASKAKQFFERYMAEREPSLDYLRIEIAGASVPWNRMVLDSTPESLVPVWEYFLAHITTEAKPESDLAAAPEWVRNDVSAVTFAPETKRRIIWVSFYFAEVVQRQFPKVKWGIAKRAQFRNQPALLGFTHVYDLSPLTLVEAEAWKALRNGSDPTALRNALERWRERT